MRLITTFHFFALLCPVVVSDVITRVYYISPDVNVTPRSLPSCGNRSRTLYVKYSSLKSVIEDMKKVDVDDSTDTQCCVVFSPTVHFVEHGTLMGVAIFRKTMNLTLMGEDGDRTKITCTGKSFRPALYLSGFDKLVITNLTFTGCYADDQVQGQSLSAVVSVNNTRWLVMRWCKFVENEGIGVEVKNVFDSVEISHCWFNGSNVRTSAGVHFTIDHSFSRGLSAVVMTVEFCNFLNLNYTALTRTDICVGRGAGVCVIGKPTVYPVNVYILSSSFHNNSASSGAGVYINVESSSKNFHVVIDKCVFSGCQVKNSSVEGHIARDGHGGAIGLFFFGNSQGTINITNSMLESNYAITGAGIAVFFAEDSIKIQVAVAKSNFKKNWGKQGGAFSLNNVMKQGNWPMPTICHDTLFDGNRVLSDGIGSAVVTTYADLSLTGVTTVKSNNGSAFLVIGGSWLIVSDTVIFSDNRGLRGGAAHVHEHSAIRVHDGTTLIFESNTAYIGGALFVNNIGVSKTWQLLGPAAQNHQCFIVPFNDDDDLRNFHEKPLNATIKFVNNTAYVINRGGAIHAYSLDICAWQVGSGFNFTHALRSSSFLYENNQPNDISTEMVKVHANLKADVIDHTASKYLLNDDTRCSDNNTVYCVRPGLSYILDVTGQDSLGYNVTGQATVKANTVGLGFVAHQDQLRQTHLTQTLSIIAGNGLGYIYFSGYQHLTTEIIVQPSETAFKQSLYVRLMNCSAGFTYSTQYNTCVCNHKQPRLIECSFNGELRVEAGYWIGYISTGGSLVSYSCPVGYCVCPNDSCWFDPRVQPDPQCTEGRNGTLCGNCTENYSATFGSLYSKCQANCTDEYKWELPVLSLFSAFVVVVAVIFNLNVASGVLRSFVFYFQMVGFTLNAVPPGGILSQKWVAYFASIANLNIREGICMWKDLTPLKSTALQYFIPACVFVCMAIFVILARKFARMARIPVLRAFWSLLTLTYVSISYTTFILLQCVALEDGDDYYWYSDATVKCFTGQHTKFAIVAIILAIFYVIPFPFFVAFGLPWISKLKPVSDISLQAFKEQYWWGEGWNFGRRLLLIVIHCFAGEPHLHQTLMIIFISAFLAFHGQLQPYYWIRDNVVETCLLFNLVVVNAVQMYTSHTPVPSYITEAIFLVPYATAFLWLVFYAWQRFGKRRQKNISKKPQKTNSRQRQSTKTGTISTNESSHVTMQAVNTRNREKLLMSGSFDRDQIMDESSGLREPLLDDTDTH